MASTGVNVLRWSAMGLGVIYGVYHQASLKSSAKLAVAKREYEHKQSLIDKAKAEFAKKSLPLSARIESDNLIRDPENPNFDLEAYLNFIAAESK